MRPFIWIFALSVAAVACGPDSTRGEDAGSGDVGSVDVQIGERDTSGPTPGAIDASAQLANYWATTTEFATGFCACAWAEFDYPSEEVCVAAQTTIDQELESCIDDLVRQLAADAVESLECDIEGNATYNDCAVPLLCAGEDFEPCVNEREAQFEECLAIMDGAMWHSPCTAAE